MKTEDTAQWRNVRLSIHAWNPSSDPSTVKTTTERTTKEEFERLLTYRSDQQLRRWK